MNYPLATLLSSPEACSPAANAETAVALDENQDKENVSPVNTQEEPSSDNNDDFAEAPWVSPRKKKGKEPALDNGEVPEETEVAIVDKGKGPALEDDEVVSALYCHETLTEEDYAKASRASCAYRGTNGVRYRCRTPPPMPPPDRCVTPPCKPMVIPRSILTAEEIKASHEAARVMANGGPASLYKLLPAPPVDLEAEEEARKEKERQRQLKVFRDWIDWLERSNKLEFPLMQTLAWGDEEEFLEALEICRQNREFYFCRKAVRDQIKLAGRRYRGVPEEIGIL
jgi:hypothetical protein